MVQITEFGTDTLCWCRWSTVQILCVGAAGCQGLFTEQNMALQSLNLVTLVVVHKTTKGACNRKGLGSASRLFHDELNP